LISTDEIIAKSDYEIFNSEVEMKNIKMILAILTIAISVNANARDANYTTTTQSWGEPMPATTTYEAIAPSWRPRTATTTTPTGTPLLSTVPLFNVKDVKVSADGKCQIIKNGAVVKTGDFIGSPCQKIYGTQAQAATSATTYEEVPQWYLEPDYNSLQEYQQTDIRAY
jgi:hypothetical protein